MSSWPRGRSDIWIWRAMRSSSSSRFFSAAVWQQVLDAAGHLVERTRELAELILGA